MPLSEKLIVKDSRLKRTAAFLSALGCIVFFKTTALCAELSSCLPDNTQPTPKIPDLDAVTKKLLLADGGGTSGGGDIDGLKAATQTLAAIRTAIKQAGPATYTEPEKTKLLAISDRLKIVMIDKKDFPAKTKIGIQKGMAFSAWLGKDPFSALVRQSWDGLKTALDRETILHHELCVLAGIEKTGDYHKTSQYEEFRKESWRFKPEKSQICTVALFKKKIDEISNKVTPGEPVGVIPIVMSFVGTHAGQGEIGDVSEKREIRAFYVIDSSGYLRLQIAEVDRQKKSEEFLIANKKVLMDETVIVNPYEDDLYSGSTTKNVIFGDFFMNVSCTTGN